jgi:hypothetical protein
MTKLLDKFAAETNEANAVKVVVYLRKHPMSECMVSPRGAELIKLARQISTGA